MSQLRTVHSSPVDKPRSGLSLLDGSPLLAEDCVVIDHNPEEESLRVAGSYGSSSSSIDQLLEQAATWKLELESVCDQIYWLQLENLQSLDALCMAGADIAN